MLAGVERSKRIDGMTTANTEMIRKNLNSLLLDGGLLLGLIPQGLAYPLGMAPGPEQAIILVQEPPPGPPGPSGGQAPGGPGPMPGALGSPGMNPAQAHFQHCASLQHEVAAIQGQLPNHPPWERKEMRRHLRQVRYQLRHDCRG
jgi:hypothetical protein